MCLPQPSHLWRLWFDFPVGLLFSLLWLCLASLNCLLSKGVCSWLCSFFSSKPQSLQPCSLQPGLCPLHLPLHPTDMQAFMHASPYNQTHIGTQRQVQTCIYAHPPRHTHLFLMLMSLHILTDSEHLFKQLPPSCVAGCRQTKTQGEYFKWTQPLRKLQKHGCWKSTFISVEYFSVLVNTGNHIFEKSEMSFQLWDSFLLSTLPRWTFHN